MSNLWTSFKAYAKVFFTDGCFLFVYVGAPTIILELIGAKNAFWFVVTWWLAWLWLHREGEMNVGNRGE